MHLNSNVNDMALPVSIGDVILLSKIAYRLGHTLTAGRKQAPAKIQEVQQQLCSLGGALDSVARSTNSAGVGENDQTHALIGVIDNCRRTLDEITTFTSKFDTNTPPTSPSNTADDTASIKWRESLRANWKKIKWTLEGEKLEDLRKDLYAHIAALSLFMNGETSSRAVSIQNSVFEVHTMMTDVHRWFDDNLKGRNATFDTTNATTQGSGAVSREEPHRLLFELWAYLSSFRDPVLLCPQARFRDGWTDAFTGTPLGREGIFRCCCSRSSLGQDHASRDEEMRCSLLDSSLLVQIAGSKRTWQMFGYAKEVTSFMIAGVVPQDLGLFQDEVDLLAKVQVRRSLKKSLSTSLVCHEVSDKGAATSVLDLKSHMLEVDATSFSATLQANGNHFIQRSIEAVQILHYRTENPPERGTDPDLLHQRHCELVMHVQPTATGITRLIVQLDRKTRCTSEDGSKIVEIFDVECWSENMAGSKESMACDLIEIVGEPCTVAKNLLTMLKSATSELQVHYLQHARLGEDIVAERVCPDILLDDVYLNNPLALVVLDPETRLHRMILRSVSLDSVVTYELPDSAIKSLSEGSTGEEPTTLMKANFVKHHKEGTTVETRLTSFPRSILDAPSEQLGRMGSGGGEGEDAFAEPQHLQMIDLSAQ
ncbi:hypothetical protein CC86DRAFT_470129 [Ophiobolus disseminans]|uniref:Fungal N-terminal domain-containing protein n=1 Tax=Ophiobolus disseminans TaxID=1469910 RepID=A0A6A6ZLX9_9PLEO|nr:hypothetical protein CC86DRAFT_470129 [Ophiobolus disseminans]